MKWIGQHIWDFISRFRSKVYLEDVANAGSDTDAFLVKKADGEVAIRTGAEVLSDIGASSESTDLEFSGNTANGVLTYGGAAQIDVESNLTYDGGAGILTLDGTGVSMIDVRHSSDNTTDGHLRFYNTRGGNDGEDGDDCGTIQFNGQNNASGSAEMIQYGHIRTSIVERDDGDEAGIMRLQVATSNDSTSNQQQALTATGHKTNNTVDVGLGYGATSTTTIAGTLTMGSTAFVNNSGVVQVATQGTIDHDSLANFVANEHIDWTGASAGTIHATNYTNTTYTSSDFDHDALTNFVANEHLRWDNDVSGTATIHTNNITDLHGAGVNGAAGNVLTDAGDGQITDHATFTWDGSDMTVSSSSSTKPQLILENTTSDNKPSYLRFYKNRVGTNGDVVGTITFDGKDAGGAEQIYGTMITKIIDATSSNETATMELSVATSSGSASSRRNVIFGTGSNSDNDVDVEIGYGVTSVTTIAGDLDIDGDNMTSAGAMTFTPVGKYTITAPDLTGDVFHLDADTDTDNIVNIDAGALDIDTTASIAIDAADDITISATDNATFRGEDDVTISATSADGLLTLSSAHTAGQAIHIDGNENAGSIVDIDAGILDIDSTGDTAINAGSIISLESSVSKINKTYDFHTTTFENQYGSGHGSGKILKYSPANNNTATAGQVYYMRDTGTWAQANAGAVNTATAIMAVGLGGGAQATGLLIQGFVRVPYTEILNFPGSGNIDGAPIYLSTTNGHFDFTAPSGSGDFVRILGYAIDDYDTGSGQIDVLVYFDPDKTYIEIA